MAVRHLASYLEATAVRSPDAVALVDPAGESLTYRELNEQADALADSLIRAGVERGDRVGVVLPKSIIAVVSLFGIMKAGAAYVPVDFTAPTERGRRILTDCEVSAVIVDERIEDVVPPHIQVGRTIVVPSGSHSGAALPQRPAAALGSATAQGQHRPSRVGEPGDLAYILYTSGSTGIPKGVMLTHANAISFVEWCASVFDPGPGDRFSSHAPFHFDLSVLDIYLPIRVGATLFLISEELGKNPRNLARFIAANRLTVWYSTPSILTLLVQFGHLESLDCSALRLVLFAGEVFPVKHLRELQLTWPVPTYYNLYGPTETNVCTYARIPPTIPAGRETPYPIGQPCDHCEALVLDHDGCEVPPGQEGLLHMSGASVFEGYWNRPEENAAAFHEREGKRFYNTGDVVRWQEGEGFLYVGRRDRMVKRRGYRIELGEIERALYLYPAMREAAVVAVPDPASGVRITAFLSCQGEPPSIIALKTFCGKHLPPYMSPDAFIVETQLPRTSTDKVDYQRLRQRLLQPLAT